MITVFSERHRLRHHTTELTGGRLDPPFDVPERVERILARVREVGLGDVVAPEPFALDPVLRLHDPEYVRFLETVWEEWVDNGHAGEAIPHNWPARGMRQRAPHDVGGKLGYYSLGAETSISQGTWEAARSAADVALTAARRVSEGARSAFALCRPPGHHAARDLYGGYCFLNNAALAAQALRDAGADRVAVIDVDFHHGNGTQSLFYARDDVLTLSLHGDPRDTFPFFLGYADETGAEGGEGFCANYPLPPGTEFPVWSAALESALRRVAAYAPGALVVSLGVDTFVDDPISSFRLRSEDFTRYGRMLAGAGVPTVFVMEGGYAVDAIGVNTVNVLAGFEGG
jgi:acetoin utilization deacetylase AcuC-like enzyme